MMKQSLSTKLFFTLQKASQSGIDVDDNILKDEYDFCCMFVNDKYFNEWMENLFLKMTEMGKDLKLLINTKGVFENAYKPLDNQEVSQLLHVSHRTL